MATLGSGVLMLSATAEGFKKDLKSAEASTNAFQKKIQQVPEVGEKIMASFGRLSQVGSVFTLMNQNVSTLEKTIAGVNVGVGAMTVGLQLATKVTTGLKAALLGTGIGAIVVGLGYVVSKLTAERKEAEAAAPREREDWEKFFDRINERATRDTRPAAVYSDRISSEVFTRERERALRPAAELGIETERLVGGLRETERAAGRSREEMALLDLTSRATAMGLGPLIEATGAYRSVLLDIVDAPLRPVLDAVLADSTTARRIVADIAEARRSLLAIDVRRETESLRSPMEATIAEIVRMEALVARGGPVALMEEGLRRMMGVSPDPLISSMERIRTVALRLGTELDRTRGIDLIAGMVGETPSGSEALRRRLETIEAAAREARAVRGVPIVFARSGFDEMEARFDRLRARAFMDAERSLGAIERAAPQAFLEGSADAISAINAARRNATPSDPIVRVERVLERMERIDADILRRETETALALRAIRRI